jgi:CRP-like cAMP-binding protein
MVKGLLSFLNQHITLVPEDFQFLLSKLEVKSFEKKQKLTQIGEVEKTVYFITQGLARKYFLRGEEEIITHIVKEGGLITSAASFLSGEPSRYFVETLEPVTAYCISAEKIEELFLLGNKWERLGRIITTHFMLQQERLMMDNIRLTVKERFKKFMLEHAELLQRVPQKHLASYLNIKQETFSRMKHLMFDNTLRPGTNA